MKYIISILKVFIIAVLIIQSSCQKDPTEPAPSSVSVISVKGDIIESYDVIAYFGITTYNSPPIEKEYFTIYLLPKTHGSNELAMTLMYRSGSESPVVESYNIAEHSLGEDIPASEFGSGYSPRNVTDFSGYIMNSGLLSITESSASKISGEVEMNGYYVKLFESDSTRMVNINAKFIATPWSN